MLFSVALHGDIAHANFHIYGKKDSKNFPNYGEEPKIQREMVPVGFSGYP